MRAFLRPTMLLPVLLSTSACVAVAANSGAETDADEVPQQCPADYTPPLLPDMPEGCDPAAFEDRLLPGCLTEAYMIKVINDPAPSMATQMLWGRYISSPYRKGKDPETGRYQLGSLHDVINRFGADYIAALPPPGDEELAALKIWASRSLIEVEGGTFQMGDFGPMVGNHTPFTGDQDDGPLHEVTVSDFAILKHRVTYGDYDLYSRATGAEPIGFSKGSASTVRFKNFYAGSVTWEQARGYCQWLGEQIGRPLDLPTEAQWEYAARAGGQLLTVGTTIPKDELNRDVLESYSDCRSASSYATPIGTYPPNALGIYEMVGSGDEWVRDWYSADYYKTLAGKVSVDPVGPASGAGHVIRNGARSMGHLTFTRQSSPPEPVATSLGFRCATPPQP